MEWIKFDVWDYALNLNEIQEQILCEFGRKIAIAIQIPSERERLGNWQRMNHIEPNTINIKTNGKEIENLEEVRNQFAEAYKIPYNLLFGKED